MDRADPCGRGTAFQAPINFRRGEPAPVRPGFGGVFMGLAQKIAPCLWFDDQGEEAAGFYTAIFPNPRIVAVTRYSDAGREIHGREPGSVMTVEFELDGHPFTALNGGPVFRFNEAISLQVF